MPRFVHGMGNSPPPPGTGPAPAPPLPPPPGWMEPAAGLILLLGGALIVGAFWLGSGSGMTPNRRRRRKMTRRMRKAWKKRGRQLGLGKRRRAGGGGLAEVVGYMEARAGLHRAHGRSKADADRRAARETLKRFHSGFVALAAKKVRLSPSAQAVIHAHRRRYGT